MYASTFSNCAAAAAGKILGLDEQRMVWTLGIAATQSAGLREMFGSMCKNLHIGRAAQNGAFAAFLAQAGFDSSERGIEARREELQLKGFEGSQVVYRIERTYNPRQA